MSGRFTRFSSNPANVRLAAFFGALLCLAITPFMAAASALVQDSFAGWSDLLFVERQFGPSLESSGLISFGDDPDTAYRTYGKGFFLVYLGLAPALFALRPLARNATGIVANANRITWQVMFIAILAAMTGDFISYWGQSIPGVIGDQLWSGGFGLELISLMALILSSLAFAVTNLAAPALPRWVSIVLILGVVALAPVNAILTDYWPNGLVLPISLSWLVIVIGLPLKVDETGIGTSQTANAAGYE